MGVRTGKPRGRPKGARNKSSVAFERVLVEKSKRVEELVDGAFSGDAHIYLMSIYKDPDMPIDKRLDAAKAALPYEKPKLSSTQHSGPNGGAIPIDLMNVSADDLNRLENLFGSLAGGSGDDAEGDQDGEG